MSAMFIDALLNRATTLSNIYTAAFTWNSVDARCSHSYFIFDGWQVVGYLLVGDGDSFDLVFGQHSAELDANYKTPGKYPKENSSSIQHGESLKSRILVIVYYRTVTSRCFQIEM